MNERNHLNKTYRGHAYCFTEQELKLLFNDCIKRFPKKNEIEYSVGLKSGMNYSVDSLEKIINRENENKSRKDKITKLTFKISSGSYSTASYQAVTIDIRYHIFYSYIDVSIDSMDIDWVDIVSTKILDSLRSMKKPWGFLHSYPFLFILSILIAGCIPAIAYKSGRENYWQTIFGLFVIIIFLAILAVPLIAYLYPQHTFAFGRENDVEIKREGLRKNIFYTLIVGSPLGLLATWFIKSLMARVL